MRHSRSLSVSLFAAVLLALACPTPGAARNVAILVFDEVQIIDSMGPYEVFGQARWNVYTVAATAQPITTAMGQVLVPRYSFANAPKTDVLVIPGGTVYGPMNDPKVMSWIRGQAKPAEVVLSVCTGALLLARAGLLDGLTATTFHNAFDELRRMAPKTKVVTNRRFVDNGKIVTSAGLSAGLDASLHVVAKLLGKARAEEIARHMEYRWDSGLD
ncbi:MAG TPA: DJ-1/PfpI family protein [Thermoanaerobaculia bacterium]|nr:DJ-1/PfpI family protein [Thermoanaerobaculia bacterium]